MPRDADKIERQMALLAMLMAERGRSLSADDIRDLIPGYSQLTNEETFKRRFSADRAELEQIGLVIAIDENHDGTQTYRLPPDRYYLPAITFTDAEVAALHACLQALDGRFPYAEPLRLALQQLALGRPAPTSPADRTLQVNLRSNDYTPQLADRIARCEEAIARRKRLIFDYYTISRDESSRREVDPWGLVMANGHWYLIGFDQTRGAQRMFRLSRMDGTPTYATKRERNDFERPEGFDLSAYRVIVPWQIGEGGEEATVWLADELAVTAERTLGDRARFEPAPSGGRLMRTHCASARALVQWVLGLGEGARVVGPPAVVEEAVASLERVAERHSGAPSEAADPDEAPESPREGTPIRRGEGVAPEKLTRLLALVARLITALEPRRIEAEVPARDVMAELGINRRDHQDAIDRLNCANFGASEYLVYAELSDGTISVQREQHSDVFARPARLSPVEARACLRALDFVGRQVIGSSDALRTAREKILSAAGLPDAPDTAVVAPFGGEATGDLAETINRGLRDGRALRLTYTPADAAQAKRYTVDPFELFNAHEAWYLAGWSRESDGERHFRLDRVAEVEVLDEPVADRPRAGDPLAWVTGGEFGGETSTGVLAFDAELARWIAEEPFPNRPRTDGGLLVWRRYASDAWLAREVCKYGGRCELLAPEGARAAVADLARRTLSAYRQPAVA